MSRPELNPVLRRELRERMRGHRTPVVVTVHLGALVVLFFLVYRGQAGTGPVPDPTELARLGRAVYDWVLVALLLLVTFLVPGLAAGAVAGERERQTLVPLQVTLLSAPRIVLGKVAASLALLALLVVVSLPVLVLTWVVGGVSLGQVVAGLVVVLVSGATLACVAVACSAGARRVQTATVVASAVTLVLVGGTLGLYRLLDPGVVGDERSPPALLLAANPLAVAAAATAPPPGSPGTQADSPLTPVRAAVAPLRGTDATTAGDEPSPISTEQIFARLLGMRAVGPPSTAPPTTEEPTGRDDVVDVGRAGTAGFGGFLTLAGAVALGLGAASIAFAAWRLRIPAKVER